MSWIGLGSSTKTIEKANPQFIEFLRTIFGEEKINSVKDVRAHLERLLSSHLHMHWTEMDYLIDVDTKCKSTSLPKEITHYSGVKSLVQTQGPSAGRHKKCNSMSEEPAQPVGDTDQSYLAKSKIIGKIGPRNALLSKNSLIGNANLKENDMEIRGIGQWSSIRGNTCVFKGKWTYEVHLRTSGLMHIGWVSQNTQLTQNHGIGDSRDSFAYDGKRMLKWNERRETYGEVWSAGDVIAAYIDLDKKEISFSRNGNSLGVAFRNIPVGENRAYFPGLSLSAGEKVVVNFGKKPMYNQHYDYKAITEADSIIHGYYTPSVFLLESFKRLLTENKSTGLKITENDKTMIAGLIMEHIFPITMDPFIMEKLIMSFFIELDIFNDTNYFEFTLESLIMHASENELQNWIQLFIKVTLENALNYVICKNDFYNEYNRYYVLMSKLLVYDKLLAGWLLTPKIMADFENLYFLNIYQKTDISKLFPDLYFDRTGGLYQEALKQKFKKNAKIYFHKASRNQEILFGITDRLMLPHSIKLADGQKVIPRLIIKKYFNSLIPKNSGYGQQLIHGGLESTPVTSLFNTCMCMIRYCKDALNAQPENFPFSLLFTYNDDEFKKLERMGGSIQHLLDKYLCKIPQFNEKIEGITPKLQEQYQMLNDIIILFNYGPLNLIQQILKGYEKYFETGRQGEEFTLNGKSTRLKNMERETRNALCATMSYQYWILTPTYLPLLHSMGLFILRLINYIDSTTPELFYFIPEYYITTAFDLFRLFLRVNCEADHIWQPPPIEQNNNKDPLIHPPRIKLPHPFPSPEYISHFITMVCNHISDPDITNPDLQEGFLTKLNIILQYKNLIPRLEGNKVASKKLLKSLLKCFAKNDLNKLSKNFLRIFKGDLFNEIHYTILTESPSPFFKYQLMDYISSNPLEASQFLNTLSLKIHNALTELKLVYDEYQGNIGLAIMQKENQRKEIKYLYLMSYNLLRVVESLILVNPEVFFNEQCIPCSRFVDLAFSVARQTLDGPLTKIIQTLVQTSFNRIESKLLFLSPITGIFINLNTSYIQLQKEKKSGISIEEMIVKADGFELLILRELRNFFYEDVKELSELDVSGLLVLQNLIEKLEKYMKINDITEKPAFIMSAQAIQAESNEYDENLCSICYANPTNCRFIPCDHSSCKKCVEIHLLSNTRCPFCNETIQTTAPFEELETAPSRHQNPKS